MDNSKKTQHFVKGEAIVTEGTVGDRSYRILRGEVLICKQNRDGQIVPIARLGEGEIFGEMYLFDRVGQRCATAVASSAEVVVEVFFQEEMETLLGPVSPAIIQMLRGYQSRLKSTSLTTAELWRGAAISRLPDGRIKPTERAGNGIILRSPEKPE